MTMKRLSMCADLIDKHYQNYSLLDLGCRTMDLKKHLIACDQYYGTDFVLQPGIFECDLENGLPQFKDNQFDIVVALDVLEHLESAHFTFKEAIRVAKKAVFVSLPNMYYVKFRFNFLFGRQLSGKYAFPPEPVKDRHRWLLSFSEACEFIDKNSCNLLTQTSIITPARGRTKLILEPIESWLAKTWPDLFGYASLHMITVENS